MRGCSTGTDLLTTLHLAKMPRVFSQGHLEKLLSLAIADSTGVNENELERERSGIIGRQFCGVRRVRAIFRGALKPVGNS